MAAPSVRNVCQNILRCRQILVSNCQHKLYRQTLNTRNYSSARFYTTAERLRKLSRGNRVILTTVGATSFGVVGFCVVGQCLQSGKAGKPIIKLDSKKYGFVQIFHKETNCTLDFSVEVKVA